MPPKLFLHPQPERTAALICAVDAVDKSLELMELARDIEREINRSIGLIAKHREDGALSLVYRERDILSELAEMRTACSILLSVAVHDVGVAGDRLEMSSAPAVSYAEGA